MTTEYPTADVPAAADAQRVQWVHEPEDLEWEPLEPEPAVWRILTAGALIIGLLVAVVLPLIIDQRKRAQDDVTKAFLTNLTNAIGLYVTEHSEVPSLVIGADARVTIDGSVVAVVPPHVELGPLTGDAETWCVDVTNPKGDHAKSEGYYWDQEDDKIDRGLCP